MLSTTTGTTYPTLFKKMSVGSSLNQWPPAKKICGYSTELTNLVAVAFKRNQEKFAKKKKERHWAITLTEAVSETLEFPASDWPEVQRIGL